MRADFRAFVAAVLGMTIVGSLEAQIIRRPVQTRRPTAWVNGSLGLLINNDVDDGSTGSYWEFAQAPIFRVGFEQALQGSSAYGLAGGIARVPLTYSSNTDVLCTSCDADAVVTQLLLTFHNGGTSLGFYSVFEAQGGITMFSDFRQRGSGRKIGPPGIDADPTFAISYGFGYALSRILQVQLVQDFGLNIHQHTNLAGGSRTTSAQYVTRIGVRYGLGG